MEKLKDKFNDILNDALVYWEEVKFTQHNEECAEEARRLALAFANYQENSQMMKISVCLRKHCLINF